MYVYVDFKGRSCKIDDEDVQGTMNDVMESGGALLKIDAESVCEYTGKPDDPWSKL